MCERGWVFGKELLRYFYGMGYRGIRCMWLVIDVFIRESVLFFYSVESFLSLEVNSFIDLVSGC